MQDIRIDDKDSREMIGRKLMAVRQRLEIERSLPTKEREGPLYGADLELAEKVFSGMLNT